MNISNTGGDSFTADADGMMMLQSMGFTEPQARLALKETQNNLERAADWLFSHQPDLDMLVAQDQQGGPPAPAGGQRPQYTDGEPR